MVYVGSKKLICHLIWGKCIDIYTPIAADNITFGEKKEGKKEYRSKAINDIL